VPRTRGPRPPASAVCIGGRVIDEQGDPDETGDVTCIAAVLPVSPLALEMFAVHRSGGTVLLVVAGASVAAAGPSFSGWVATARRRSGVGSTAEL
jgi:hypothetical protein